MFVGALIAACGSGHSPPKRSSAPAKAPTGSTRVAVFAPFGPAAPALTRTASGQCWTSSIVVASQDAYRCFAGAQILDPCFARPLSRVVSCYADPWSPGVRANLTTMLPTLTPLAVNRPWALELAGGIRCVVATGVVSHVQRVALLYRCTNGGRAGAPEPTGSTAHVPYLAPSASRPTTVAVAVSWTAR